MARKLFTFFLFLILAGCKEDEADNRPLELLQAFVGPTELDISGGITEGLPVDRTITLVFSAPVNQAAATDAVLLKKDQQTIPVDLSFLANGRSIAIYPAGTLDSHSVYTIVLSSSLQGENGERFVGREIAFQTAMADITIASVEVGGVDVTNEQRITHVAPGLDMTITFSGAIDLQSLEEAFEFSGPEVTDLNFAFSEGDQSVNITSSVPLRHLSKYQLRLLTDLKGASGENFAGYSVTLYTRENETPAFPVLPADELLTLVQQQTFKYFYDFAHPASGMARERNTSGDLVTSGGSGFGIMALIVGIERNFITRQQGLEHMDKILTFLESADRFHGAWPHWMNGNSGEVIPFSANDNGGDLVETSFLIQGLLTFRQYLDANITEEKGLIDRINALWHAVEWDWYTRDGQDVLYWHWSPDKQWAMNHRIQGYNEALITYFLAAASPTHAIGSPVYHNGWAENGGIVNNKSYYGLGLPVGYDYGGPLFFAHYSFLGLDPRGLSDTYANYWTQNRNHSLIHQAYSIDNPKNYVGYSEENWGLTASDNQDGYSAHSPTNDLGVITPTAALSSFPYTPEESMKALEFFYYTLGDRLWGEYGFYDAFNITEGWTADSYLAIDQGPIIVMIENHRTGLLWDLFMSSPEVQVAMDKLGFTR